MDDPFFVVKREVEQSLRQVAGLYQSWRQQLMASGGSAGAGDQDLRKQGSDIRDILRNIAADLDELDETIKIVQSNPARFKLDRAQIDERKQFVMEARRTVEEMRSSINNPNAARMGGQQGMRDALLTSKNTGKAGGAVDKYGRSEQDYQMSNQRFVEREQQQQQMVMEQQDRQMDDVAVTVGNLREVARVMGDELDDQTRLLGEVEAQVDTTQGRLQDGMKRMQDFIKANSSSKQQWIIAVLTIVLVVIIILVISF
ncbi:syntaxin 6, N-terminal-domain-containing protein [Entophlyctis helioformis]|nr:syntaxin 6, N-terminal-domain-containing protein [Entophlyctis helioformis]